MLELGELQTDTIDACVYFGVGKISEYLQMCCFLCGQWGSVPGGQFESRKCFSSFHYQIFLAPCMLRESSLHVEKLMDLAESHVPCSVFQEWIWMSLAYI